MNTENTNTAAQNDASNETRTAWPQRFGIMTSLQVKQGRNGRYAIATIDCNKFEQTAFVFNKMALDKLIAAGEGAKVWVKGPIEAVQRDGYSEDVFKVVYAKDITPEPEAATGDEGAAAEGDDAPEVNETDETVSNGAADAEASQDIDDEIPF